MKEIKQYSFFWRAEDDTGSLHMALEDETGADIFIDSAGEAAFLLDLLRNEKPCYYHVDTGQISTGLHMVNED